MSRGLIQVLLAVALAATLIIVLRFAVAERLVSGDSFWYARYAAMLSGSPTPTEDAARFMRASRGDDPGKWVSLVDQGDPRYAAIFSARPLYPLAAAPFVKVVGLNALFAVSMVAGIICAVLVAATSWAWWQSPAAAFVGGVMVVALPSGAWFSIAYADGLMLVLWAACVGSASAYLLRGGVAWLASMAVTLVGLYLTKPANGAVIVIAVLALLAAAVIARRAWQRAMVVAAIALLLGALHLIASEAFGIAGLSVTLQDLATQHFRHPNVADPVGDLLRRNAFLLSSLPGMAFEALVPLLLAGCGLGILCMLRSSAASLWVLAGVASIAIVILHPLPSEFPRLLAPIWLPVAVGLGLGAGRLVASVRPTPTQLPASP